MRNQATRCSQADLAYLAYWKAKGYDIKPGEPVPNNTLTPPSLATRRPVLDALLGVAIILAALGMVGLWIAQAAGILGA